MNDVVVHVSLTIRIAEDAPGSTIFALGFVSATHRRRRKMRAHYCVTYEYTHGLMRGAY